MIRLCLSLDADGCLTVLKAEGHAGQGEAGTDLVCAAFTTLMKTLFNLLSTAEGLLLEAGAEKEGRAFLRILSCATEKRPWLKGVSDYFLRGMADLRLAYPANLSIEINANLED